jgi:hypothetical protein
MSSDSNDLGPLGADCFEFVYGNLSEYVMVSCNLNAMFVFSSGALVFSPRYLDGSLDVLIAPERSY